MISEIEYATLLNFSPRGMTEISKVSRTVCYGFKNGSVENINRLGQVLIEEQGKPENIFENFFGGDVTLIPMPRSSLKVEGGLWPAKLISDCIFENGLAKEVKCILERKYAVQKSSQAPAGQRPSVRNHFDSFNILGNELFQPQKITLIDDVLTKGSTAFGAALKLEELFPNVPIRIFSPIRTQGLISDILVLKEPSRGLIHFDGTDVSRNP